MAMYVDEYGIIDTNCLVHAVPIDPCAQCDDENHHHTNEYVIHLLLAVGGQGYQLAQMYPTKGLRDAAFEKLCAKVQQEQLIEEGDSYE